MDSSRMRLSSWAIRERTKSCRCLAASYSAFSDRSPCAAAVCSSFGILKVSSCFRSASSFLSRVRMGSSIATPLRRCRLGQDTARDLARLPTIVPAGELLAQPTHDRAERTRSRLRRELANHLFELLHTQLRGNVGLEQLPLGLVLLDQVLSPCLGREAFGFLALADLPAHQLDELLFAQRGATL